MYHGFDQVIVVILLDQPLLVLGARLDALAVIAIDNDVVVGSMHIDLADLCLAAALTFGK